MIGSKPPSHQRNPAKPALFAGLLLLAGACGGGGGGGSAPNLAPYLVTAAFVGATATPAPGDTLLLFFSEDVALVAGKLLGNDDVALSDGKSLGAVTAAPVLVSARSVSVQLGTGVDFAPGTTTIALSTGNDAVADGAGKLGLEGTPVTIGTSDGSAPVIATVTIAGIDGALNGTGAAGGTLQVPQSDWTIDLAYSDNGAIDTARTQIVANVTVTAAGAAQPAGTNLVPFLTVNSATNTAASYRVPGAVTFAAGALTLTCMVVDASGLASATAGFSASVRAFSDALRPFETSANAQQVWYLDFTRDVEAFTATAVSGGATVAIVASANGRSDCEDVLHLLGLQHSAPIGNVSGGQNSNEFVLALWKTRMLARLAALFSGANIAFTLTQPSGSFGNSSSVAYGSLSHSRISVAGSSSSAGVLGVAIFDPSNATQNDNTRLDFQGIRLGIFLHTIASSGMSPPGSTPFHQTFDTFAPALGGTAIGANGQDGQRLLNAALDARAAAIDDAITEFAHFTALLIAHECGHSMGLVENGAMPTGLYGNDTTHFPGSADGHIRNTALFPGGATNVMSPSLTYSAAVHPSSAFNSLNLAYLREQVFYGN